LLDAREQVEAALKAAADASSEQEAREARRLLEEAIRQEGEALEESAQPAAAGGGGAVAVGQRVRMASGSTGELVELRDDGKAIVVAGAIRLVVPAESLTFAPGKGEGGKLEKGKSSPHSPFPSLPPSPAAAMEIDLRGMRGDEAAATTTAALDAAVLADHPYLRIIHGMGTGVVRESVRRVLAADRRVARFDFAPRNQGGTGVTIAEFAP
jgi:DNA mismatch repair protein MutS2